MRKASIVLLKAFILNVLFISIGSAQTVAPDWTKSDCSGTAHHLYDELNAGKIVIMDFAMTYMDYPGTTSPCQPCSTATAFLTRLHARYEASHPDLLKHYAMGYTNVYTCDDIATWQQNLGFDVTSFTKCAADVKNYGGMGMPTIAIAAGSDHRVLYKKVGFTLKDTTAVIAAIESALASASVHNVQAASGVKLISVLTREGAQYLNLQLAQQARVKIDIINAVGKTETSMAEESVSEGEPSVMLDTHALASGRYFARVTVNSVEAGTVSFTVVR